MRPPLLTAVRVRYGCHDRRFDLPLEPRPVVISGPNGSGKTTLLEAFLRTLYGFSRRLAAERTHLETRRPWSGRTAEAEVELISIGGDRISVRRDFETDEVVARDLESDTELFRGDGNPVGTGSSARRFRELASGWIGLSNLEPYRKTAWVGQGELVDTRLDDELLRAAAGTHRKVETAQDELRGEHDELTWEPIEPGGRRKNLPRDLETQREAAEDLATRLAAARSAREKRRPLVAEVAGFDRRVEALDGEIELLEAAYRPLAEHRTLVAEEREARARLSALSDALQSLTEADRGTGRARGAVQAAEAGGVYPEEFGSRLAQADVLWEREAALEKELATGFAPAGERAAPASGVARLAAVAGVVLVLGGIATSVLGSAALGVSAAVLGAFLTGAAVRAARGQRPGSEGVAARVTRELEDTRTRLADLAADVPRPAFEPAAADEHRAGFARQVKARQAARQAERVQAEALSRALSLLDAAGAAAGEPADDTPGTLNRLRGAEEEARTALARVQVRLEEQPAVPELPEGVEPTVPAVDVARTDRRAERSEIVERRTHLELELRDAERAAEDEFGLERELASARERIEETEAEVQVRREAWNLVRDAYVDFRERDQERLLGAVNERLAALSDGRLGPVEATGELADACVHMADRPVRLESPPLSFGEKHMVLFAIRLGSADFLAGEGVRHPLLVDEPFTHLDERNARQVWDLLCSLAEERQVIVGTQNRLFLDHLGIVPDIDLSAPAPRPEASRMLDAERVRGPAERSETGSGREKAERDAALARRVAEQAQLELG